MNIKKTLFFIPFLFTSLYAGTSYTINYTHNTVKDNSTGLTWNRCTLLKNNIINDDGNCNGLTETDRYNWNEAISACNKLSSDRYRGYDNWRLPNIRELHSIVTYYFSTFPAITAKAFPNTKDDHYWTSTTAKKDNTLAWRVDFNLGTVLYGDKNDKKYVRCVAGP